MKQVLQWEGTHYSSTPPTEAGSSTNTRQVPEVVVRFLQSRSEEWVVTYVVTKTVKMPSPCGFLAVGGTVRQQLRNWLLADGNSESYWIGREQRDALHNR